MHSHAENKKSSLENIFSLNPCFNGRCTRTAEVEKKLKERIQVLILVLMEDALAQTRFATKRK